MKPKELTHLIRNAQSAIGDPGVNIDLVKNRLKGLVEVLEQHGEKIFALPDYSKGVVDLMLERHKMKLETVAKEEEKDDVVEYNGPKLIVNNALAGGEPPLITPGDWLTPLQDGTVFFVQSKQNPMDFNLGFFRKVRTDNKVIMLQSPQLPKEIYVNPVRFCNSFTLYQEMFVLEEKADDDGNRDQPATGAEKHPVDGLEGG